MMFKRHWLWVVGLLLSLVYIFVVHPEPKPENVPPATLAPGTRVESKGDQKESQVPLETPPLAPKSTGQFEPVKAMEHQQKPTERYPPNLAASQVYFEVIEGDLAITAGDIILGKLPEENKGLKAGVFEPPRSSLWPSPEIPYVIANDIRNPTPILEAIEYFKTHTPVRFVPAEEGDQDVIVFVTASEHCASHLGRVGGPQPILVSENCGKSEILHELMHALGFVHEHARLDRDQFVKVMWENIQEVFYPQFNKMPDQWLHEYTGSVFDFDSESIMLYPENAFVKSPGLKSLESKMGRNLQPVRGELSRIDRERVFYLYGR